MAIFLNWATSQVDCVQLNVIITDWGWDKISFHQEVTVAACGTSEHVSLSDAYVVGSLAPGKNKLTSHRLPHLFTTGQNWNESALSTHPNPPTQPLTSSCQLTDKELVLSKSFLIETPTQTRAPWASVVKSSSKNVKPEAVSLKAYNKFCSNQNCLLSFWTKCYIWMLWHLPVFKERGLYKGVTHWRFTLGCVLHTAGEKKSVLLIFDVYILF